MIKQTRYDKTTDTWIVVNEEMGPEQVINPGQKNQDEPVYNPETRSWSIATRSVEHGGPGSGNFGHEGRPGERGGSAPGGGAPSESGVGKDRRDIDPDLRDKKVGGGLYEAMKPTIDRDTARVKEDLAREKKYEGEHPLTPEKKKEFGIPEKAPEEKDLPPPAERLAKGLGVDEDTLKKSTWQELDKKLELVRDHQGVAYDRYINKHDELKGKGVPIGEINDHPEMRGITRDSEVLEKAERRIVELKMERDQDPIEKGGPGHGEFGKETPADRAQRIAAGGETDAEIAKRYADSPYMRGPHQGIEEQRSFPGRQLKPEDFPGPRGNKPALEEAQRVELERELKTNPTLKAGVEEAKRVSEGKGGKPLGTLTEPLKKTAELKGEHQAAMDRSEKALKAVGAKHRELIDRGISPDEVMKHPEYAKVNSEHWLAYQDEMKARQKYADRLDEENPDKPGAKEYAKTMWM